MGLKWEIQPYFGPVAVAMARMNVSEAKKETGGMMAKASRLASSQSVLASCLKAEGEYDEAISLFQHTLAILVKIRGATSGAVAEALNSLAEVFFAQGKYEEALQVGERKSESEREERERRVGLGVSLRSLRSAAPPRTCPARRTPPPDC